MVCSIWANTLCEILFAITALCLILRKLCNIDLINPPGAETRRLQEKYVNTVAAMICMSKVYYFHMKETWEHVLHWQQSPIMGKSPQVLDASSRSWALTDSTTTHCCVERPNYSIITHPSTKQIGISRTVSHTRHNNEPIGDRKDSPLAPAERYIIYVCRSHENMKGRSFSLSLSSGNVSAACIIPTQGCNNTKSSIYVSYWYKWYYDIILHYHSLDLPIEHTNAQHI